MRGRAPRRGHAAPSRTRATCLCTREEDLGAKAPSPTPLRNRHRTGCCSCHRWSPAREAPRGKDRRRSPRARRAPAGRGRTRRGAGHVVQSRSCERPHSATHGPRGVRTGLSSVCRRSTPGPVGNWKQVPAGLRMMRGGDSPGVRGPNVAGTRCGFSAVTPVVQCALGLGAVADSTIPIRRQDAHRP